jgi:hypothetical protein
MRNIYGRILGHRVHLPAVPKSRAIDLQVLGTRSEPRQIKTAFSESSQISPFFFSTLFSISF